MKNIIFLFLTGIMFSTTLDENTTIIVDSDVDVIHPHTDRGYHFVNNILVEG